MRDREKWWKCTETHGEEEARADGYFRIRNKAGRKWDSIKTQKENTPRLYLKF